MDMTVRERRYYLGGCCTTLSMIQDTVCGIVRDGCDFAADDLLYVGSQLYWHEFAESSSADDDDDDDEDTDEDEPDDTRPAIPLLTEAEFQTYATQWQAGELDPWYQLLFVFRALLPELMKSTPDGVSKPEPTIKHLSSMLKSALSSIWWREIFEGAQNGKPRHNAQRLLRWAKAYNLIKEILPHFDRVTETFNGFAIIDPEGNVVETNTGGQCIFATRLEAVQMIDLWRSRELEPHSAPDEVPVDELRIVPVTIDVEHGLQIQVEPAS